MNLPTSLQEHLEKEALVHGDKIYDATPGFPSDKEWPRLKAIYAFKEGAQSLYAKLTEMNMGLAAASIESESKNAANRYLINSLAKSIAEIANIVGFKGEESDELVEFVKSKMSRTNALIDELEEYGKYLPEFKTGLESISRYRKENE